MPSRGQHNLQILLKAKGSIPKLPAPMPAAEKAALLKIVTAVIPEVQKSLKIAVQLRKDEDILRALKKKGATDAQIQKYADAKMKYREPLMKQVYKISQDLEKAADIADKQQKEMKKQKQDKLAAELEKLAGEIWGVSQDHDSYTRWKEEAVD